MSGFCSGAFAAFLTTPFDVAKTRRQVLERRASSLTAIFREIYHHEGVLGLFKGIFISGFKYTRPFSSRYKSGARMCNNDNHIRIWEKIVITSLVQ